MAAHIEPIFVRSHLTICVRFQLTIIIQSYNCCRVSCYNYVRGCHTIWVEFKNKESLPCLSASIRINQHLSANIRINQNQSASNRTNQHQLGPISINQDQSASIRTNHHQSEAITTNQNQSEPISINQNQAASNFNIGNLCQFFF